MSNNKLSPGTSIINGFRSTSLHVKLEGTVLKGPIHCCWFVCETDSTLYVNVCVCVCVCQSPRRSTNPLGSRRATVIA